MENLRITATMMTGQIATIDRCLPLDSILAWAWMNENRPDLMAASQSSIRDEEIVDAALPLERRGEGEDWYWACSFACGEAKKEQINYWHKRFDQRDAERYVNFGKRRGVIDAKSGQYKGYRMPLVIVLTPALAWYAVGDSDGVRNLLAKITHIGKKHSQGYGRIAEWKVESWQEDLSWLRAIPDEENGFIEMGIRPPYWVLAHKRRATIPADSRLLRNTKG